MTSPLLEARDVHKLFPQNGVKACDGADLEVAGGEVHAVVGENGAGKSTLMQIIAGVTPPDAGDVLVRGEPVPAHDPAASRRAGVVMSYQHPRLVRELTVLENLFLGEEPVRFGLFDSAVGAARVARVAPHFDQSLLVRRLGSLSSGQVRMVSLVAALLNLPADRPGILILDEPTEACTPDEVGSVFNVIRAAAEAGHGVVFISHRLPEVERIANTVTVMRGGRTVRVFRDGFDVRTLARTMVGAAEADAIATPADRTPQSTPRHTGHEHRLVLEHLTVGAGGRTLLRDITLTVSSGEIVGVTGIRENGIEALEDLLGGRLQPTRGRFSVDGADATGRSSAHLRRMGLRYVPTDRLLRGASVQSSVSENLIALRRRDLQRAGVLDAEEVQRFAHDLRERYEIEGGLHLPLWQLSGGNIQKVILSRELEGSPRVLVICEPSWGLDFRARARIVERIRRAARDGAGVLVLSTDIDEVLELADRVMVLYDGAVAGAMPRAEASRAVLGRLMAGETGGTDA